MKSNSFSRFAGWSAILAGASGVLYSLAFIVLKSDLLSALFLLLGGLFSIAPLTELYRHLREVDVSFARLAFAMSIGAAVGSLIHGGYDLSNALHPPAAPNLDLPNPIDPRGLLTFGVAGLGLFFISWLMSRDNAFPGMLSSLGYVSSVLLVLIYLGRLIILQATNLAIVIPALLEGFIVNPVWYIWLGAVLLRRK
jgi:hypothetical protein